ncbi:hypothetical protein Taro_014305 [Colocasia esculenta]|uniref:DUF8040 domain-containing protein n=1 Tax=Colocasia esculenta TaxID=4460 RepID=A0A843UIH6_COLES|nr:hypothetical protein [Colocasia esculenta]
MQVNSEFVCQLALSKYFLISVARRRLLLSILLEEEEMFDVVIQFVCEEMDTPPRIPRRMMNTSEYTGEMWVNSILTRHEKRYYNVFRLHPHVFTTLRDLLVNKSLIGDSRDVSASQQLAMFLYAVGHGAPTGVLVEHFQHSSQTISHYVNKLAIALASLKDDYILQPTHTNEIHPHIAGNERFYPFFKPPCAPLSRRAAAAAQHHAQRVAGPRVPNPRELKQSFREEPIPYIPLPLLPSRRHVPQELQPHSGDVHRDRTLPSPAPAEDDGGDGAGAASRQEGGLAGGLPSAEVPEETEGGNEERKGKVGAEAAEDGGEVRGEAGAAFGGSRSF